MRFVQLANHFGGRYRHLIMAMDGKTGAYELLAPNVDAQLLAVENQRGRTLVNVQNFRRVLVRTRPDLLVTYNWGAIEWAMANLLVGRPHLHMEDGFGPEEADRQIPRRVWTRRLTLRRSTVLLPSQTLVNIARSRWRIPEANLIHVPNGIDCARFAAAPDWDFAYTVGIPRGDRIVGTIAGLRAEKNLRRLVEAFALVAQQHRARLVIVGDGAERADLERRATELGVRERVVFTGNCAQPEKLLPCFDVFALSSDTEQMPLSVLEAMAAGRPIASTAVGDVAGMVAEENRPYVVSRGVEPLADAILALLMNPGGAAEIGAANARRARAQFAQQRMFDVYEQLFDGQLKGVR